MTMLSSADNSRTTTTEARSPMVSGSVVGLPTATRAMSPNSIASTTSGEGLLTAASLRLRASVAASAIAVERMTPTWIDSPKESRSVTL